MKINQISTGSERPKRAHSFVAQNVERLEYSHRIISKTVSPLKVRFPSDEEDLKEEMNDAKGG